MAGLIDESILEQILSRVDIVEIISESIPLKRSGRNFKASCPFHHEKTASFMVSAEKQIFHCFGCGAGGNAFKFLMQYDRMEFPEAVEKLARKAGVIIPEKHRSPAAGQTQQVIKALELACGYFQEKLLSGAGKDARNYLGRRGVRPETAKIFRLGYSPDLWDGLIAHLKSKEINLAVMEKAGLVLPKDGGGYYDRFRGRVMFAITNLKSEVIGFGARTLGSAEPKYLNSPETPVYVKGKNLFNLDLAKEALRETDRLVLVEGYMDCLIPYQEGLRNIAASCGTALTPEQAKLIKRFTPNVVVLYDGDKAGQMATLRSLDIFLEEEMHVRVAALPDKEDPDTFVRKNGIAALQELVDKGANLFDYKLRLLRAANDEKTQEGRRRITAEMLPTIKKVPNAVQRSDYIRMLAERLKMSEESLLTELNKIKEENPYSYRGILQTGTANADGWIHPTEKQLIKLMFEQNSLISHVQGAVTPSDFQDTASSRLVALMFESWAQGKELKTSLMVNDPEISAIIRSTTMDESLEVEEENRETTLHDCIDRLKKKSLMVKQRRLQDAIKQAETDNDEQLKTRLMVEFNNLIKTR